MLSRNNSSFNDITKIYEDIYAYTGDVEENAYLKEILYNISQALPSFLVGCTMDQISIKTPNPKCRLFLKIGQ